MKTQFGAKLSKSDQEKYAKYENWDGGKFLNLEETTMEISFQTLPKLLYKQFCEKASREPKSKLPIVPFNEVDFLSNSAGAKFIWYGHSVVLLRMAGKTILIDPMFGSNAAPVSPFPVKRFSEDTLEIIDELPEIDMVLMTHDHYDHLDYSSIQKLKSKVKEYYVAIGVKRHLVKWGIDEKLITEFFWWESSLFGDIQITFTPSRHFSGRGLTDRAKSLWGGWTFRTAKQNIWFSGDGGYGKHFHEIGKRLGPFDFGFIECGQYNENWHQIHMYPEESIQAAIDGNADLIMPVHWAGFSLAQHTWTDPVERFVAEAERRGIKWIAPQLGEIVDISAAGQTSKWWDW